MNRIEFDKLVDSLENRYRERPQRLRWQVAIAVALVMGLLLAGILFWLGIGLLMIVCGLRNPDYAIPLLGLGAICCAVGLINAICCLLLRVPYPKGIAITEQAAPVLFNELDRLGTLLRCSKFDAVLLSPEFNASVRRIPRLSFWGWNRSVLVLGSHLMSLLSYPEFQAVLAHELGHLSKQHGRFGNWLYGIRVTWDYLVGQMQSDTRPGLRRGPFALLLRWLSRVWPRLNARLFVLSRIAEYEADAHSAACTSAEDLAHGLWRTDCFSASLNEIFWPALRRSALSEPELPSEITARIVNYLATPPRLLDAKRWNTQTARIATDTIDTHPAFRDRVTAVRLSPATFEELAYPSVPAISAMDHIFGSKRSELQRSLDLIWKDENEAGWIAEQGKLRTWQTRADQIKKISDYRSDTILLWEFAVATYHLEGLEIAARVAAEILQLKPEHFAAAEMLGRHLLLHDPPAGVEQLSKVMQSDQNDLIESAGEALAQYYLREGEVALAKQTRVAILENVRLNQASAGERAQIKASDTFIAHTLTTTELSELQILLRQQVDLKFAWLVQKKTLAHQNRRLFVLCVESHGQYWRTRADDDLRVASSVMCQIQLPGQTFVVTPTSPLVAIARRVIRFPDSLIYSSLHLD